MAIVNLGSIKFNWKGAYAGGTAYAVDDVVSYNGSSYVCTAASTGNLPTDTNFWDQMSGKGTDADLLNITGTVQGDLYYNNGSAIARLGAGTSGQALVTGGTGANPSWSTVGGSNTPAWSVYRSTNQNNIPNSSFTKVQFDVEDFDTDNAYDHNGGDYHFTVPSGKAGKYFIQFSVNVGGIGDNKTERVYTQLRKNGAVLLYGTNQDLTSDADAINHNTYGSSCIVDLAVGDDIDVRAFHLFNTDSTGRFMGGSEKATRFSGFKLL